MNLLPKVTVAIPTYNGGEFILESIDSVLSQSFTDFELLIVDDASTNSSFEFIHQLGDDRIQLLTFPVNLGPVGNFNRCVENAKGKYLKILCHDDILDSECLDLQVKALDKHPLDQQPICTSLKKVINSNGVQIFSSLGFRGPTRLIKGHEAVRKCVKSGRNLIGETSTVLMHTKSIQSAGPFKTNYTLDLDMWFRLLKTSDCEFISLPLSSFRIHGGSSTSTLKKYQAKEFITLTKWAEGEFSNISKLTRIVGGLYCYLGQYLRRMLYRFESFKK
jgi:glycosyltransferase involved in cell wall biosynthesis